MSTLVINGITLVVGDIVLYIMLLVVVPVVKSVCSMLVDLYWFHLLLLFVGP